jgi:magnesium-protoporphyrin O-methyltransferase
MSGGCCDTSGYRGAFNRKLAKRNVRSFQRKGLDSTAGPMVDALRSKGVIGASVLEIGAGSGAALVTLLEAGAGSATAFEISPAYEAEARALFDARGITAPLEWHTGDFVAEADGVAGSDVVFLNRVVCCYPHMEDMVDAAGSKTVRLLAMAYPRDRWPVRLFLRVLNRWLRFRKNSFRVFLHDPDSVAARATAGGLHEVAAGMTTTWHWRVWERPAGNP